MPNKISTFKFLILACALALGSVAVAQKRPQPSRNSVPGPTLLLITKAEDERRWDNDLSGLLSSPSTAIRKRALLAAGRIGDEDSVTPLKKLLAEDPDAGVRAMAAFALGEVQSVAA